jgi:hypothetical protein
MSGSGPGRAWWALAPPALVVLVTIVAFLPALGAGFVNWDDPENFLRNPAYRGLDGTHLRWMLSTFHMGVYIPLTWLTLAADHALWGMDPRGYHATSVLFHAGVALAFYFLSLRLLRLGVGPQARGGDLRLGAAAVALLFAVHPLRAESVAWVTERRDLVSGLLAVLCVIAYLRSAEREPADRRWYWLAVLLFLGALLGKVIAAMIAPVLVVLDLYPLRRLGGARGWRVRRVWLEKLPFLALAAAASAVAFAAVHADSYLHPLAEMSLGFRLMLSLYGGAFYLLKTAWPVGLSPLYQLPLVVTWGHLAIVAAGTVLAVAARRRWPAFAAAWVAYLVILFPVAGLFHNGPQAAADRYSYLSCMSWAVLAGAGVARAGGVAWRAALARAAAAVAITALGILTWQQAGIWRDGVSLWSHAVAVNPASRSAHSKLGEAYAQAGRRPEAIAHYGEALRLSINKAPYHVIIGRLLAESGDRAGAGAHFAAALRLSPGLPEACAGLGAVGAMPPEIRRGCP